MIRNLKKIITTKTEIQKDNFHIGTGLIDKLFDRLLDSKISANQDFKDNVRIVVKKITHHFNEVHKFEHHDKGALFAFYKNLFKQHHPKDTDDNNNGGGDNDNNNNNNNFEAREVDGSNNNLTHPELGKSGTNFTTTSGYAYDDGYSTPNDDDRPSARAVSNELFAQGGNIYNTHDMSNFLWVWGQFLDHDMSLTREGHGEEYDINVPTGDIYFDPYATGTQVIDLTRSGYADGTGTDAANPRQQVNELTSFIDASNVYGATAEKNAELRDVGGKLKLSNGDLLPIVMGEHGPEFLAGDVRANENVALTSMHTIFAREHNYWVDQIAIKHPEYSDEQLYQHARAIIEAEIQHISYDEFLPALLGKNALAEYTGYNASIDPRIATEFATAAFRVGHTMLSSDIYRMQENGQGSEYGNLSLQEAFFRPDTVMNQGGIDEILRGLTSSYAQNIDSQIIDDVRNFLFGPPGAGGFDLVSLNIQRGRDHGLPDYNSVRESYGLDPVDSFEQLTDNPELVAKLTALYGDISNLDLWVGGLLEPSFGDAMIGETFYTIIVDQFTRLRDGDRFWYEERLDDDTVATVNHTSLSDIIMRNSDVAYLQDDIFAMKYRMGGDDSDNVLHGSNNEDLIVGFGGDDIIYGHDGADVLYGGEGADLFVFDVITDAMDIIRDFNVNEDRISLEGLIEGFGSCIQGSLDRFIFTTQQEDGLKISVGNSINDNRQDIVLLEDVRTDHALAFIDYNTQNVA